MSESVCEGGGGGLVQSYKKEVTAMVSVSFENVV